MKSRVFKLVFTLVFVSASLKAALPPLEGRREIEATNIVEGVVENVITRLVDHGHRSIDMQYRVKLRVTNVLKGGGISLSAPIEIYFWKMFSRPRGVVGPSGQSGQMYVTRKIRAYLVKKNGRFELLEPDGFTVIAD